ncbi:unnamed protein product [Gongylonema pulchrum]|uniref:C4 n=1 Tax=Gongylonema pulchrum TaxID=637853 RepID=A0A183DCE7_9BILA|nr:unnamed protein product [Gongylonema pulchrum]
MGNCFSSRSTRQMSPSVSGIRNERASPKFSADRSSVEPLKESNCNEMLTPRRQETHGGPQGTAF